MVRVELERGTLLAVEVPEGASDLTLPKVGMIDLYFQTKIQSENEEDNYISFALPDVGFEPLGLATDIAEDQAKIVVETVKPHGCKGTYYKEYNNTRSFYSTAIQSMQSLLQANKIYSVNPFGSKQPSIDSYNIENASQDYVNGLEIEISINREEWQEAQQDVKNWFLLFNYKK